MNAIAVKPRLGRITNPTFGFDEATMKLCEFRFVADFGNNESALIRVRGEEFIRLALAQMDVVSSDKIEGKFAKFEQSGGAIDVVGFLDTEKSREAEKQFLS